MPADFDDRLAAVDDALSEHADADGTDAHLRRGGQTDDQDAHCRPDGRTHAMDALSSREGHNDEGSGERLDAPTDGTGSKVAGSDDGDPVGVDALRDRVAELEAAVQALRGYAGSVRAVNDRVEERADAAVSTVDSLERDVERCQDAIDSLQREFDSLGRDVESDARRAAESRPGATGDDSWGGSVRGEPATRSKWAENSGSGSRGGDRARSTDTGCEQRCVCGRSTHGRGRVGTGRGDDAEHDESNDGDGADDGGAIAWPPAEPRAPYGEVDADDDRERPGLVARLRDAL